MATGIQTPYQVQVNFAQDVTGLELRSQLATIHTERIGRYTLAVAICAVIAASLFANKQIKSNANINKNTIRADFSFKMVE